MTPDDVARFLIELILKLPPDLRPGAFGFVQGVAATQPYWTPVVVFLLALTVIGAVFFSAESVA